MCEVSVSLELNTTTQEYLIRFPLEKNALVGENGEKEAMDTNLPVFQSSNFKKKGYTIPLIII